MTIHERERPRPNPTDGQIGLRVNGKEYGGWKTATVTRGIESGCGSFNLNVSEKWGTETEHWPIYEEDECVVVIGRKKLITGYVDRRNPSFTATSHGLTLTGRDKVGDLVDCSANPALDKWEFKGVSVLQFAKKVAAPYGISVTLQGGLTDSVLPAPPKKLVIDPGDTAFTAIERACRMAGLLPVSDGLGGLVLTRAGTERTDTEIVQGENMLAGDGDFNAAERFRHYHVLGQHRGTANFNGVSAAPPRGTAEDTHVRRTTRTMIIRPECAVTKDYAKKRAQWEATTRAARADAVTATVQGWTQKSGLLWPVNALVRVRSQKLGIKGDMLITQATYRIGEQEGTTTELTLKRPDAFKPEPTIQPSSEGAYKELARGV